MKRIQRMRKKGWRKPANTLNITRPGRHGNPYPITGSLTREESLEKFGSYLDELKRDDPEEYARLIREVHEAEYIMCWCALNVSCHGDIWIERAMEAE